jgi:hypothetical protein
MNILTYQFYIGPFGGGEGGGPPPGALLIACGYLSVLLPQSENPGGGTPWGANLGEPKLLC